MKKLTFVFLFLAISASAKGTYTRGYTKSGGTYVAPYHRTAPDSTIRNNYSTKGNVNPYTGKAGTITRKRATK